MGISAPTDAQWMTLAIEQAKQAQKVNEVPVGAILIQNNQLISSAYNQPISNNDPTAHAEIQLLRAAGKQLNNYRLYDTTLYVTLEPCTMCLGAIVHARVSYIVFGAYDQKSGVCGSCINLQNSQCFNHSINIQGGILADQCKDLLQQFFKSRRIDS
ncbi:CMP/dCMP deaminase, zinc-binding protein [Candidatus Ruthia magnifica str. Cm (Calyptogena magnifica)]|uniref:tRNA-specific adenosine deaminase n=1 Tax=Ruthia magnifica subsp. Calyptogena magnifica TaxID=413404 RepID=A1AXH1_RUTMC|nr:tRNA adenosine(34) deaminase TadA [Candidatus Ruthturnera calyptogenae]ABL02628.1 CMP/dCMP deaminase, zinc-binding protein [Candidatus Ruthia magnifica str. Cm (Calyptogena magnifica)]